MKKIISNLLFTLCLLLTAATAQAQEQMENNINEVNSFLKECKYYQIATVENDQPHVRPFGVSEIINGRIYIMTGKVKNVFKQMQANPKFEICAVKPSGSEWIRITGKLVIDEDTKTKEEILNRNPGLKSMYSATDSNMAILYITSGEATISSFAAAPRTLRF